MYKITERQAVSYARRSLSGVTGIAIIEYAEREDAKGCVTSRREFLKPQSPMQREERLCPVQLPVDWRTTCLFQEMIKKVSDGAGCLIHI